jgi:hypothetical protein
MPLIRQWTTMIGRTWFELILLVTSLLVGCSRPAAPVDETPFREAIGQYLQSNSMAMKIKEIKQGPVVEGDSASLQASMTHEKLGGPSVTWHFQFTRGADGSWQVIRHED